MAAPKIGISFNTEELESLVPSSAEMSVIGALVTAPDRDTSLLVNTLYDVTTDDSAFYTKLGAGGTAQQTMVLVGKQLGQMGRSSRMVMNIVTKGADDFATIAAMVGNPVTKTGMHKFKEAGQRVAVIPRILIAPGFTSQQHSGVVNILIGSGGAGYAVGNAITGTGGGGTGFAATVTTVSATGAITGFDITNGGQNYTSAPTLAAAVGVGGTAATLTAVVGKLTNPLAAEFPTVCESLLAVALVGGPSTTKQAAIDWRETMESKRLIPTDTAVLIADANGDPVQVPNEAVIAGMINRVDELHGGMPFHTAANRTPYGILGPARYTDFSLTDGDAEAQQLLTNDIGVIVRGEAGDDFAIAEGGSVYLGVGTCSNESLWQFYNQVRGRDWIHLILLRTLRELLGKYNLTNRLVIVYVNTIRKILARLAAEELIHREFKVDLVPSLNTPADLRQGKLTVRMSVEEPAPFLHGIIKSSRYEFALEAFIEDLQAQISQTAI